MSEISKQALKVDNSTSFPNNTTGYISPTILRAFNVNVIDSTVNQAEYTLNSGSWNVSIGQLNAYTASFTPSFTGLNQFTASQLVINTGYNSFTQSANSSISQLNTQTASFYQYTASINQIQSNGTVLGTSTRFNLVGPGTFFSASLTPNVNGPIATLTFTSDNAKTNTSSFNDYTASNNQRVSSLESNSASVNISVNALNQFTASDNTSQAALNAFTASQLILNSGFTTTASFNSYTSSTNNAISLLSNNTGSYATTGSNSLNGNQIITGSLLISGSGINDLTVVGQIFVSSSATGTNTAPKITVSGSNGQTTINRSGISTKDASNEANLNPLGIWNTNLSTFDEIGISVDPINYGISNWSNGPVIYVNNDAGDSYNAVFGFQDKANYTDGRITALMPFNPTAGILSTTISGSLTITGSVYGNVLSITTSAQTASIDLSKANYFTLTLSGSTKINVTNPQPGVTATLVINTSTGATSSFSSNVKQPSGSLYVASPSGNIDIISFTAVNSTTVYAFPAQSFV